MHPIVHPRLRTALTAAFLSGCAVAPVPLEAQVTGEPRDQRVDWLVQALVRPGDPGLAIIVTRGATIAHQAGYGLADLDRGRRNRPSTMFHMASAGKQFTALGIMMLAEAGRLRYDDPIGQYLPEFARFGNGMTIRTLLHHTSGIPDYYDDSTGLRRLRAIDPTPSNAAALTLLATWGTAGPAGEKFEYSNTGYDVLGALLERVSGQSLDRFLQQRVFEPLGMTETWSMPNARYGDSARARGYDRNGRRWDVDDYDPLDELVGSGSVYSSVEDLYRYDQALAGDRLVQQSTWAEAYRPTRLNDGSEIPYGFAWDLGERNGLHWVGHGGSWEGYRSYILRFLGQHLSVYLLTNRSDLDAEELTFKVADLYLAPGAP